MRNWLTFALACVAMVLSASEAALAQNAPPQNSETGAAVDEGAFTIALPIQFDGRALPPATFVATTQSVVSVVAGELISSFGDRLSEEAQSALAALPDGFVPVETIRDQVGIDLSLEPQSLIVTATADDSVISAQTIDFSANDRLGDLDRVEPGVFSFGADTAFIVEAEPDDFREPELQLDVSGFANIGGQDGLYFDYNFFLTFNEGDFFDRGPFLAFYDDRENAIRYSAGDNFTPFSSTLGSTNLLGFRAQRLFGELQPNRIVRPLGQRSIVLERRARVDIRINGATVRSFFADAGRLDLDNLPFADINNQVEIVIEDDRGVQVIDAFTFSTSRDLLAEGVFEFSVNAGLLPDESQSVFTYTSDPAFAGSARYGATPVLTLSAQAQASEEYAGAGAGFALSLDPGVLGVEAAVTRLEGFGEGAAVSASYQADFDGLFGFRDLLTLSAQYFSEDYALLGDDTPLFSTEFDIDASYSTVVTPALNLNFSASGGTVHGQSGEDYSLSLAGSYRLGNAVLSLLGRHRGGSGSETSVFAGLTLQLGDRTTARATYDTSSDTGSAEIRRLASNAIGDFGYNARAEFDHGDDEAQFTGEVTYVANRAELVASVTESLDFNGGSNTTAEARVETGFAFVDGKFAIGRRPGRGFYLFDTHPSLDDATINAGLDFEGKPRATSDGLGPAIIPTGRPYAPEVIRISVDDAPIGYDIGPGAYVGEPGALTGHSIVVGSDAFRSAAGRLTLNGAPLQLSFARAVRNDGLAEANMTFTNRNGRFLISNLSPGDYTIEIDGRRFSVAFNIADDDPAFVELGELELVRR